MMDTYRIVDAEGFETTIKSTTALAAISGFRSQYGWSAADAIVRVELLPMR